MRHATRITLFVQHSDGCLDILPDLEVLHALLGQVPLVSRNPDGSRTLVFDLQDPASALAHPVLPHLPDAERLRAHIAALAAEARALGLPLTAALADKVERVAEAELCQCGPPGRRD